MLLYYETIIFIFLLSIQKHYNNKLILFIFFTLQMILVSFPEIKEKSILHSHFTRWRTSVPKMASLLSYQRKFHEKTDYKYTATVASIRLKYVSNQ